MDVAMQDSENSDAASQVSYLQTIVESRTGEDEAMPKFLILWFELGRERLISREERYAN